MAVDAKPVSAYCERYLSIACWTTARSYGGGLLRLGRTSRRGPLTALTAYASLTLSEIIANIVTYTAAGASCSKWIQ